MPSVAFAPPMSTHFSQFLRPLNCAPPPHPLSFSESIRASASSCWPSSFKARFALVSQPWRRVTKASVVQVSEEEPIGDIVEKLVRTDGVPEDTKLYVGNLPYNVDSAELARIVQEYAVPELIEVIYDRDTGRSKGFAFVTMSTTEECNMIIENLDGAQYQGRPLRVNMAAKPRASQPLYKETEHKLFIGNLSWTVTSESLRSVFEEYGDVVDARVLHDGETGKSRGYGFVCYSKRDEMDAALQQLDGQVVVLDMESLEFGNLEIVCDLGMQELEGRSMRVGVAEGRKARYDQ